MAPRHVCDGLTHLAGRLDQIVQTWNVVDSGPPSPDQIERLYHAQHLDQALHLLRAQISVEYARELEAAVVGPLRRFHPNREIKIIHAKRYEILASEADD